MTHSQRKVGTSPEVIPFARAAQSAQGDNDQLDKAGQTILQLLNRAANVAEENSRHAIDMAQKLSQQLRAAEDRIAELEADIAAHQERADRAEQWLHKVHTEIEDRFLGQTEHVRRGARRQ
jgi:DNA repair exonuclease SbcCD ATPase subunit